MAIFSPERVWWKPLGREERLWVTVSAVWCFFMFFMLIGWYFLGAQNLPTKTMRITPAQFQTLTDAFVQANKVGEEAGIPIVHVPAGGDAYLIAKQWQWTPILELEVGKTYTLHLSSLDVQHGFSVQPINLNLQIFPGYDFIVTVTPNRTGEYGLICNEFCSIGHHLMTGKIIVK
ncbi:MAG: cytochrome C oxidase subunit II [Chloroflexi bacterium]|nr:cytochrome C oxidase subunit II [Chloroflexota bacterium]